MKWRTVVGSGTILAIRQSCRSSYPDVCISPFQGTKSPYDFNQSKWQMLVERQNIRIFSLQNLLSISATVPSPGSRKKNRTLSRGG